MMRDKEERRKKKGRRTYNLRERMKRENEERKRIKQTKRDSMI